MYGIGEGFIRKKISLGDMSINTRHPTSSWLDLFHKIS